MKNLIPPKEERS